MKKLTRLTAALLALMVGLALSLPACSSQEAEPSAAPAAPSQVPVGLAASAGGFADVDAGAWYAGAVDYVRKHELMNGVDGGRFDPEGTLTRAMLVTVLWRQAGEPVVNYLMDFSDVAGGQWYTEAVRWAAGEKLVGGYGDGRFGTNDPITQEHLNLIFQRYTDRPVTGGIPGFDGSARPATRAQAAAAVMNYARLPQQPAGQGRTLVAYFSATHNTENVANHIAAILDADLFEIVPETPYTSADLNYNDNSSRANREQNDPAARPAIDGAVEDMAQYDVVFLGYPIWHGQAPKIISTFLESYDLSGKTIVPFCTSGSSPMGSSAANLQALAPGADWLEGRRFGGGASREDVEGWLSGLDLPENEDAGTPEGGKDMLKIAVNGTALTATLADNSSAQALKELLAEGPITIQMHDYGNFEKVGPLGQSLPTNNEQIHTQAGDLILYQGDQFVIYYDTNTWNFTRLGRINHVSAQELREVLGDGDVSVTLSIG